MPPDFRASTCIQLRWDITLLSVLAGMDDISEIMIKWQSDDER